MTENKMREIDMTCYNPKLVKLLLEYIYSDTYLNPLEYGDNIAELFEMLSLVNMYEQKDYSRH